MYFPTKIILPLLSIVVGYLSWGAFQNPAYMSLSLLMLPIWFHSSNRLIAWLNYFLYVLMASRGLIQGSSFFFESFTIGVLVWFIGNLWQSLPFLLWFNNKNKRTVGLIFALLLIAVPPFALTGWAHPLSTIGVAWQGGGYIALGFVLIFTVFFINRYWWLYSLPFLIAINLKQVGKTIPGWKSIDTAFQIKGQSFSDDYKRQTSIINTLNKTNNDTELFLLPETVAGFWLEGNKSLWKTQYVNKAVVLIGATIVKERRLNNTVILIKNKESEELYKQRQPVPIGMWIPFVNDKFNAFLFDEQQAVKTVLGKKTVFLLCYEQYLMFPMLQSAFYKPDYIVGMSNLWWVNDENSLRAIQRNIVYAWARLFNLPFLYSENH